MAALVRETYEPGMDVSLVAHKYGVGASLTVMASPSSAVDGRIGSSALAGTEEEWG